MPISRSSRLAVPFSRAIGSDMTQPKPISGAATQALTCSGIEQRQRLGHQLAQDDVEDRDDDEGDDRRDRVGGEQGRLRREPGERALDHARQRRLADPAESEGGQRDPELGGGDVAVERLNGRAGEPSFAVARLGHLIEPRPPRADQRKLRGHEEGVGEHQHDDGREAEQDRR